MLAAIGAFNLVGTIGSGWLSDRFDSRWLLFWYYGLRGLSLFYLPSTDIGFYELAIFNAFYGLDWLDTVTPTVKLNAEIGRAWCRERVDKYVKNWGVDGQLNKKKNNK